MSVLKRDSRILTVPFLFCNPLQLKSFLRVAKGRFVPYILYNMQKIVLIDDDKDTCELLKNALEKTGCYQGFTANTAVKGEGLCMAEIPDLIFLDFVMPDENGDRV